MTRSKEVSSLGQGLARVSSFDAAVGTVQGLRRRLAAVVKEPECASPRITSPLKPQKLETRMSGDAYSGSGRGLRRAGEAGK